MQSKGVLGALATMILNRRQNMNSTTKTEDKEKDKEKEDSEDDSWDKRLIAQP